MDCQSTYVNKNCLLFTHFIFIYLVPLEINYPQCLGNFKDFFLVYFVIS